MLSAQKEQIRLVASDTSEKDLPNVGSFGKVVNSIQGLQQRLETFSAEDVGGAYDRTQTLLLRLTELQRKLITYAAIKESMAAVRDSLDQMLLDCVELGKSEAPETPLSIQTLIHANKLIQFPRLNKLANAFAHQVAEQQNEAVTNRVPVNDGCPQTLQTNPNPDDHFETQLPPKTDIFLSESNSPSPHEVTTVASEEEENGVDALLIPLASDSSATSALCADVEVASTAVTSEDLQALNCEPPEPERTPVDTGVNAANTKNNQNALPVTNSTEFDQRLLDDLIKNYGEFTAALGSFHTNETSVSADADQHASEIEYQDPVPSMKVGPERNTLPSLRKEGDLDRQLKELIKDYGEYDLYSRQRPLNLKTGVVAAFLLLALILSGIYYFSPKTVDSQRSLNASPAHTNSSSTTEPKDSENLANQPGARVSEAGTSHATGNNSRPKSKN
ncbi:MAG: hypothetical protein ACM3TN_24660 [Alphaproteobacteria bacterium]